MQSSAARQSLRSRQRGGCHRAGAIDAARRAAPAPRRPVSGPLTRRHPTLGRPLSHRAGAGAEASKSARENALHGLILLPAPTAPHRAEAGAHMVSTDAALRRCPLLGDFVAEVGDGESVAAGAKFLI